MRLIKLMVCLLVVMPAIVHGQEDRGIEQNNFDRSVRPQDDLYLAVNGSWLEATEIPSDKSNYGSFSVLADNAEEQIHEIMKQCAESPGEVGTNRYKVGELYKSFMDTEAIEKRGIQPVLTELKKIEKLDSHASIASYFGYLNKIGVTTPMGFFVTIDNKNSTRYIAAMIQRGLSLPDRDYYLKDDEKYDAAKKALGDYIKTLFEITGSAEESDFSSDIIALETKLAEAHWSRTELRDANKRYNLFRVKDLNEIGTNIPWLSFLKQANAGDIEEINIMTPSYFEKLNSILTDTPVETWKQYLKYKVIDSFAPFQGKSLVDAHFNFHEKTLAGVPEQKKRWKKAVELIGSQGALGEAVGEIYVEKHFPPENKAKMDKLVKNLLAAFGQSIDELEWMTDATKVKAKEKLAKIKTKIGYTDKWRDYSKLEVIPGDLFQNVKNVIEFQYNRMIDKLTQPIDRSEWGMTPFTVNAYYNPAMNEIVFPAAILQPPFFNVEADDAVNYGGIGAVIGHEISHAFDDQGSKFDGDGNLNNWWTDEDRSAFKALTERLIAQYETYEPLPGKTVNGKLTLGENIADLSGLAIAFKAYQISLEGEESPKIAGWSGNQRVFLGWSQVWRRKYRDAEMLRRLLTDPHSPSWYRANGPVTNIDAFYEAFDVRSGDKLFKPKEERIKIW